MILIGLGANLDGAFGSPEKSLHFAINRLIDNGVSVAKCSNIWKSAPVPVSDQPWYCNAVCCAESDLPAHEFLEMFWNIENEAGRTRHKINEARVLDLDLLAYDNLIITDERLYIPHPRMHERAFVLFPLREIAPEWVHPVIRKNVVEMILALDGGQKIERTDISTLVG